MIQLERIVHPRLHSSRDLVTPAMQSDELFLCKLWRNDGFGKLQYRVGDCTQDVSAVEGKLCDIPKLSRKQRNTISCLSCLDINSCENDGQCIRGKSGLNSEAECQYRAIYRRVFTHYRCSW